MRKIILLLSALVFASNSFAGWQKGVITKILVHDNGGGVEKIDVRLSNTSVNNMEWCSSSNEWTIILASEASKIQTSLILSAYVSEKEITLHSDVSKNCPADGNRNRVRNVEVR
ncbi:hypothetical protein [Aliiglaciecola sp. M165]|uniref:hypothetical protein n=1 Tax=Aliiglaciecola sp. M165 TaxID=2593649 RepID=UPI00117CE50D|nr:hypothetical protein [Aliiglaciecola sp. M165]TRY33408.1 hypothetical protein FM019_05385 [Aliiglaciecola sp. M165]